MNFDRPSLGVKLSDITGEFHQQLVCDISLADLPHPWSILEVNIVVDVYCQVACNVKQLQSKTEDKPFGFFIFQMYTNIVSWQFSTPNSC